MSDALEQDQTDIAARLEADEYFEDITVLVQRKGVTESDIDAALSVLNEKASKIGACVVVLIPSLVPETPNVPGPAYEIMATVQVIEQPLFNLGDTGTGKSAEQIAQRVRQLLHHFTNGLGRVFNFAGMEPLAVDEGKISYGVKFSRDAGDAPLAKVATPSLSTDSATAPGTVTITCDTAGATILYSLDGSYPTLPYTAPLAVATAATVRAVAEKTGLQQSNVRQLTLT